MTQSSGMPWELVQNSWLPNDVADPSLPFQIAGFWKRAGRGFPLPGLEEEERCRARRQDRQKGNPSVNTGTALLTTVGVAALGAKGTYRL